ncbi:hypothetical protein LMG29739_02806 [Paraburkholderia solisilvae]|uniref:Uncharacterized protein n=1 Tax=Paraburkholderia solisilvae TaxID=624376 RepID=A0A6J5DWH8_9BURK|nr:hypothetical protein LMG29739_02806 [Paraburkholderia solisilvae]
MRSESPFTPRSLTAGDDLRFAPIARKPAALAYSLATTETS